MMTRLDQKEDTGMEIRPDETVLDLGCGVGAAALCLLARAPEVEVTGLEIQAELAGLARENARLNGWDDRFRVVDGDLNRQPGCRGR